MIHTNKQDVHPGHNPQSQMIYIATIPQTMSQARSMFMQIIAQSKRQKFGNRINKAC